MDINGKQFDINNTSTDDIKNMMYDNLNTAEKDTLQEMMNTMKPLFDKVSQIENVITIWSNKALQVKENLLFKTRRKDGTIIQTNVDDIQIKLADLFSILAQ